MAEVTLKPKDYLVSLVSLLRKVADAIEWVCQQEGEITLDVQEEHPSIGEGVVRGIGCHYTPRPIVRTDVEILIAILNKMKGKTPKRIAGKPKRRK